MLRRPGEHTGLAGAAVSLLAVVGQAGYGVAQDLDEAAVGLHGQGDSRARELDLEVPVLGGVVRRLKAVAER